MRTTSLASVIHRPLSTELYDAWRRAADEATDAFDAWSSCTPNDRGNAFLVYQVALDREERAANAFACGVR